MLLDLKNKNVPINGRIAIVDDEFKQVLPLIELFGRMQYPYLYYTGDLKGLPEEGKAFNDIRILFLDINLTGDEIRNDKEVKSKLIPVLNRIISENNYPYLLIYWSRHEKEHGKLVENIFQNELKNKAPINILTIQKSDYFSLTGEETDDFYEKITGLFSRIEAAISEYSIFKYLLNWENLVHSAADNTLEEIFKTNSVLDEWDKNSHSLFYKLARSLAGMGFDNLPRLEQIRSGLLSFNYVFYDTLEHFISSKLEINEGDKLTKLEDADNQNIYAVNKKLLFSNERENKKLPGIVSIVDQSINNYKDYKKILHNSILINDLLNDNHNVKNVCEKIKDIVDEKLHKTTKRNAEKTIIQKFKIKIKETWLPIETNVTPICDFVQGKEEYSRLLPGLFIEQKFKKYFNNKTEAIFISPNFDLNLDIGERRIEGTYFMLLDFRFFTSIIKDSLEDHMNPIMRIRQQLLNEIQSKLSRHINRQGILFLDD